jgi:hypothetical protein
MKLYTQCIMSSKTMKQMDQVIANMYTTPGLVSENFAAMSQIVLETISTHAETIL